MIMLETEYGTFDVSTRVGGIRAGLAQLQHYKKVGSSSKPQELDWEIRLYEFILKQPDPEAAAAQYFDARDDGTGMPVNKRKLVKKLGWEIP